MKRRTGEKGFTIVEVLVAAMVIGLAATATAKGMRAATNLLGENELQAEAITMAQEAVEDLRTLRYEDIVDGSRTAQEFTTAWNVAANNPEAGMKFITVTTSWKWKGEARSYKIETIYSKLTPR